jgi:hypothetical protein
VRQRIWRRGFQLSVTGGCSNRSSKVSVNPVRVDSTRARTCGSRRASVRAVPSRKQPLGPSSPARYYIMEERPDEVTTALLELLARPCVISHEAGIPRA